MMQPALLYGAEAMPESLSSSGNPYQSPQASFVRQVVPCNWKAVLKRWEILRFLYNLLVGLAGLLILAMFAGHLSPKAGLGYIVVGVAIYGFCANLAYFLGPAAELYMNWIADVWEGRLVPRWACDLIRSHYITMVLFAAGCLFSIGLTLLIGIAELPVTPF
jgi:hypothetical protein